MKSTELGNAFPGQVVAVSGEAGSDRPLVSEQAQTPCIYFDYTIDRSYRIGVTRQRSSGHGQETVQQQRRETVALDKQWVPFHVSDDSGQVSVSPDGAWFEGVSVMERVEPVTDNNKNGLPGQKMNLSKGGGATGEYSIREHAIKIGQPVFVVGPVNEHGQIERNGRHDVIVSHRPISELGEEWGSHSRSRLFGCFGAFALGLLAIVGGTVATAMSLI